MSEDGIIVRTYRLNPEVRSEIDRVNAYIGPNGSDADFVAAVKTLGPQGRLPILWGSDPFVCRQ